MEQKRNQILYLGNQLQARGNSTPTTIDTLSALLREEGFHVITASAKRLKFFRMLDMLWHLIKHRKTVSKILIDTYSTQNFWYAVAIGNLSRLIKIPYYPILHGGNLPRRLENNAAQSKKLFHGATKNISPSLYLMEAFEKKGYHNIIHIPNSIDLSRYQFAGRRASFPKILWVRSFAEIYNPKMALEILNILKPTYPQAELCMVGPDKDGSLEQCKVFANNHGLDVKFTGKLSKEEWIDLAKEYNVFLNTSNFDNLPVSIIEAMALGLPVVSTDVGGLPFLIDPYKTGMLYPAMDANTAAERIKSLMNDPELQNSIARAGRAQAEKFDWKQVRQQWIEFLNQ